jgi:hypothetical protein
MIMKKYEVIDELGNHLATLVAKCIEDAEFEASCIFTKPVIIKEKEASSPEDMS